MVGKGTDHCEVDGAGHRFNTMSSINEIIHELVANLKATAKFPDKKWRRLHLDNARPHTSQASVDYIDRHKFVRVSHPPYPPDLAPSDFYRFGCLNGKLAKCHGTTKDDRFRNVTDNLDSISEKELTQVFLNWMRRLEKVISIGGEYIEISTFNIWFREFPPSASSRLSTFMR